VVQVHDIQYDGLGREVLKNQTVTWSNSHYGMVPGLSDGLNGWQNGTATVTTATVYDDQGRVISTNSSGFVSPGATNADLAKSKYYGVIVASGFAFRSHSFSMVYDYMGRLVSSSYDNVSPGARSRSSSKKTVAVYEQRNFGTTTYSDFDPFGRAGTISSTSNTRWAGSKNKSSGTSLVTNIVYNSLGNVISQNEKYTSVSKVGKIKSTTRGEKNVTFTYNSKNELTARNETKVWEKTKTSSSGSKLGGLMKIFSIVLTVIALVLMQPYIVNAVYAVEGATVGLASSFAAGGSSFAAVVAGGSFTQALVAGAMMAAATFVVNFTVTLVFTGDFKAALRAGVMAGIGGFLSVMTVWVGGQFTGVMETLKSINGTLVNNLTDGVGKVFDGVISDVSKLLDGMKVFGTKIGTELASMMAKDMVTTLVKDVVTSLVSDTMTEKSPNLGFLSGLVSTVAIGLLGFGPSNFLSSFRPIMASMANAALGWILQKVLPSKMSWLSSMIMSFFKFETRNEGDVYEYEMAGREQNRIETVGNFFSFTPTEGNFLQIFKQGVFGSIASLGVVILEKQFGKYLYQSGGGLPNRLTFAGSFLVDNLRGFVGGFLSMLDRKAEKSDPVAQEKSLKSEAQTKAENIYNQGRMTEASPVPYENLEKSDSAIEQSGWGDVMGGDVANLFKEFTVDGGQSQGGAESGWASSKEVGSQGVYMTGGAETLFSFGKSFLSKISLTEGSESMGSVESDALGYGFSPLEKTEVGSNPLVTKIDQATNLNISDKFLLSATLPRLSAEQTVFLVNHMEAIVAGSVRLAGGLWA
jgi:hypothetical protein